MAVLTDYTYVFALGTIFALLEAFNNGASKFLLLLCNIPLVLADSGCLC